MSTLNEFAVRVPRITKAVHRCVRLDNGLTVINIQDPVAEMPAAAMTIGAGSLCDPVDFPGLAHFCEHMLFMGTSKYPKEDEYDAFVTNNGGNSNAYTSDMATTFYFTVSDDALFGTLDRFVSFFVEPMFSESSVEREVQAVHSEDEKNHGVDYWRLDEVLRTFYNPAHPHYRYGNGNAETLWNRPRAQGLNLREALLQFYDKYYASEVACLVVFSRHSLEEILNVVSPTLSKMKTYPNASPSPQASFSFLPHLPHPFADHALGKWINVKTCKKLMNIRLYWPMKLDFHSTKLSHPALYASHILGHECNSSILGVLKAEGLGTSLTSGLKNSIDDDFDLFYVDVGLTDKGFRDVLHVGEIIFQAIALIVRHGSVDQQTYRQMIQEELLNFELEDLESPATHCAKLSGAALRYGPEHAWCGQSLISLEDEAQSFELAKKSLTVANCFVVFMWGEFNAGEGMTAPSDKNDEDEEDDEDEDDAAPTTTVLSESMLPEFLFPATTDNPQQRWTRAPIHGAFFSQTPIPCDILQRWGRWESSSVLAGIDPRLQFPPLNPFISTDFTIFSASSDTPPEVVVTPFGKHCIKQDPGRHRVPKTGVCLSTLSPVAYASPLNSFFTRILVAILKEHLTEIIYFAELAGINNDITHAEGGFSTAVEGPTEKIFSFFLTMLRSALPHDVLVGSKDKFTCYKSLTIRTISSAKSSQPYELAMYLNRGLTAPCFIPFTDVLDAAMDDTLSSYENYISYLSAFRQVPMKIECTVFGNMPSVAFVEANFCRDLDALLAELGFLPMSQGASPPPPPIPRFRDSYLPCQHGRIKPEQQSGTTKDDADDEVVAYMHKDDVWLFDEKPSFAPNKDNPNAAVIASIVVGRETARNRALCDIFHRLVSSEFFTQLRTVEALGYVVSMQTSRVNDAVFSRFIVQSALPECADPMYLLSRIVAFIDFVEDVLIPTQWSDEQLNNVKNALIRARQDLPKSVKAELQEMDQDMQHPNTYFHRQLEIDAIRCISLDDVREFFKAKVSNRGTREEGEFVKCRLLVVVHRNRVVRQFAEEETEKEGGGGAQRQPNLRVFHHRLRPKATTTENASSVAPGGEGAKSTGQLFLPTFADPEAQRVVHLVEFSVEHHAIALGECLRHPSF